MMGDLVDLTAERKRRRLGHSDVAVIGPYSFGDENVTMVGAVGFRAKLQAGGPVGYSLTCPDCGDVFGSTYLTCPECTRPLE